MTTETDLVSFELDSPVGVLLLVGNERGIAAIHFKSGRRSSPVDPRWPVSEAPFGAVIEQLGEYFAGRRRRFELTLTPTGTPFQQAVWRELQAIPYGETTSYGALARRIGKPTAFRAAGAANGANPWPIVVPCHRVIGSDRSLTGFGGGLPTKQALLRLEAEVSGSQRSLALGS
jgi:methylated-DNA-[protein]-cysteine S-methyltransferase